MLTHKPCRNFPSLASAKGFKELLVALKIMPMKLVLFMPIHMEEGYVVAQLVEALRYKPGGHGLGSRWCHWNFSLT
jgi:hypothetical protein